MRRIERTTQFKRDFKREAKGRYKEFLETSLIEVIELLVKNNELADWYFDHALTG